MASATAVTIEQVAALLRGRRSVDLYQSDPVPKAVILEAIDVARWAPNHRLTQPWRFYLIGPATRRSVTDLAVRARRGEERRAGGSHSSSAARRRAGLPRAHDTPQRRRAARTRGLRRMLLRRAKSHAVSVAVRHRNEVDHGRHHARPSFLCVARHRRGERVRCRLHLVWQTESRCRHTNANPRPNS